MLFNSMPRSLAVNTDVPPAGLRPRRGPVVPARPPKPFRWQKFQKNFLFRRRGAHRALELGSGVARNVGQPDEQREDRHRELGGINVSDAQHGLEVHARDQLDSRARGRRRFHAGELVTKAARLAQLERDFDSPLNRATGQMRIDEYLSKRAALESEPDPLPAPPPKTAAAPRSSAVTMANLKSITEAVGEAVGKRFKESDGRVADLESRAVQRVEALEARVAELERLTAKSNMRYRGVWCEAPHLPGDTVTHKGTLWHCTEATSDRPGTSGSWQLMVKHER
jgi:hypothetical protein